MNQENAPHMQPMEQAGERGAVPYPPYNEGRPATEAAAPNAQPAQTSIPPYEYGQGQFPPYPAQGTQMQPYPGMPYGMPYGGYPQPGYTVPAHNLPPTAQMANANGQPSQGQPFSVNMANNPEPQVAAQGAPGYPIGYQQPQTGYPQQRFSSSPQQQTHTLCSQRRRSPTPKRCSNRLRMPTRASSLSCPPLWSRQRMTKITPTQ